MIRILAILLLCGQSAQAHGTWTGAGGFVSGALHPFVALDHLLALATAGLVLGRDGMRLPLVALGAGLGAGLMLGGFASPLLLPGLALGLAGGLAAQLRAPLALACLALLAVGLGIGGQTDLAPETRSMAILGLGVTVFLVAMNSYALGAALAASRAAFVLRVAGAWILAATLMVLGLTLRGPA